MSAQLFAVRLTANFSASFGNTYIKWFNPWMPNGGTFVPEMLWMLLDVLDIQYEIDWDFW